MSLDTFTSVNAATAFNDSVPFDPFTRREPTTIALAHAARRLAYRPAAWRHAVRFSSESRTYTRIPLPAEDGYEAWLLAWLPGQSTGLHDHAGSSGAFVVVDGTLHEDTAEQDLDGRTTLRGRTLAAGDLRGFGPDHVHEVRNDSSEPAVSIHVYAPALSAMRRYALEGAHLVTLREDRVGVDW
jgi:predicted metal-dependent enzyme (double-stranded beta helix superfamily)